MNVLFHSDYINNERKFYKMSTVEIFMFNKRKRSVYPQWYVYMTKRSHALCVYIPYHIYLFILNMQKPFPA